ncbi:hypothetical protein FVE85_8456 [Porphyridium purpureum]|uniref:Uncharacterized protein n=1 Tax=Porphyridium purpureum TaxID=35688 RepID=A0A5J4YMR9_PORPP|nr:hypothetical protein FVE85_8456 [Porphyridium purpureum]|eukprot:POR2022..scf244_11
MDWVSNGLASLRDLRKGGGGGGAAASAGDGVDAVFVRFSATNIWEYSVKARKRLPVGSLVRVFDPSNDSIIYESDIQTSPCPQFRKMCEVRLSGGRVNIDELAVGFYYVDMKKYHKIPLTSRGIKNLLGEEPGLHLVVAEKIPIASIRRQGTYEMGQLIGKPESAELAEKLDWKEAVLCIHMEPDLSQEFSKTHPEGKAHGIVVCHPFVKFQDEDDEEYPVTLEVYRKLLNHPHERSVLVGATKPGGITSQATGEAEGLNMYEALHLDYREWSQCDPTKRVQIYLLCYVPPSKLRKSVEKAKSKASLLSSSPNISNDAAAVRKVLLGYTDISIAELRGALRSTDKPFSLSKSITSEVLGSLREKGAYNIHTPESVGMGPYSVAYAMHFK